MAAAGSIVVTTLDVGAGITKYTVVWTSDASGNVSANTLGVKRGRLLQAKFIPGASTLQPSDLYDMTLLDPDGVDLLAGAGANLSNANASISVPAAPIFTEGEAVAPTIANAGISKGGTLNLYIGP